MSEPALPGSAEPSPAQLPVLSTGAAVPGRPSSRFDPAAAGRALLPLAGLAGLLVAWEAAVRLLSVPGWILPPPTRVAATLVERWPVIAPQAGVTALEIVAGLVVGSATGVAAALLMARWPLAERLAGPILVASQALPVFAVAPLLVVWFGFGLVSKVVMASLIIFFPVASAFLEGLRRTDRGLLDLARLHGATPGQRLRLVQIPFALPALASGLRVAAAVAPIGAVVGEWVGASSGLGLLILHANARMQTDTVFAALTVLAALSIALWLAVDRLTRRLVRWAPDTLRT